MRTFLFVLFISTAAFAQTTTTDSQPSISATPWSVGSGLFLDSAGYSLGIVTGYTTPFLSGGPIGVPTGVVSIERELSRNVRLIAGINVGYTRSGNQVPDSPEVTSTSWYFNAQASAGVRGILARPTARTSFSIDASAVGGVNKQRYQYISSSSYSGGFVCTSGLCQPSGAAVGPQASLSQYSTTTTAGINVGAAAEYELLEGLSVRIGSMLGSAALSSYVASSGGKDTSKGSGFGFGARIRPYIELRLAF